MSFREPTGGPDKPPVGMMELLEPVGVAVVSPTAVQGMLGGTMNWWNRLLEAGVILEHLYSFALPCEDNKDLKVALEAVKRILDRRKGLEMLQEEMKFLTR